jgi:AsmA protein
LRLDATLDSGLLKVTALQGKIWNGAVDATASADANSGRIAMKGGATGIDLSRAVKDVADKDWIEGNGRVTMDIASTGRSVNALKSAMQGQLALKLSNGAVKGINLGKAIGNARSAIGLGQHQAQKTSDTEKTEFSEMSVSFQVSGGVAHSKDLDIRSPLLNIGGEGDIDIGKSRIDYLARATVLGRDKGADKSSDKGSAGSDLLAFKGLQVPVRLSGPFSALGWNFEWAAVKLGAELGKQLRSGAQDVLQKSLGLKQDTPADKNAQPAKKDSLGDKLKGLIR